MHPLITFLIILCLLLFFISVKPLWLLYIVVALVLLFMAGMVTSLFYGG